jgi:hypothetical protein
LRSILICACFLGTIAGCASTAPPPSNNKAVAGTQTVHYSREQKTRLTYCMGLADTAWNIATMKLAGKTKEQVRATYASHPNPTLILAEIDEVFGRKFTHTWNFTVDFFRECAVNVAKLRAESTGTAAYCLQNAMLSGLAQEQKAAGRSKQQAVDGLPIKGDTPTALVNKVYAGDQTRAAAMMSAWNDCVDPMVTN